MADSRGYVRFETMLIGGGQAGLAASYHLAWRERSVMISDARRRKIGRLVNPTYIRHTWPHGLHISLEPEPSHE